MVIYNTACLPYPRLVFTICAAHRTSTKPPTHYVEAFRVPIYAACRGLGTTPRLSLSFLHKYRYNPMEFRRSIAGRFHL